MRNKLVVGVLVGILSMGIAATPVVAASSNETDDFSGKRVGLVMTGNTLDYFNYIGASANYVASQNGVDLTISSAADDTSTVELVEQALAAKYDVIIAASRALYLPNFLDINEAGIPLITFDNVMDGYERVANICTDNYQMGVDCAKVAIEYMEGKDEIAGEVVVIDCPPVDVMHMRCEGFKDTFSEAFPDVKIVDALRDSSEIMLDDMNTFCTDMLSAYPSGSLDFIFGSNSNTSLGAFTALETGGRTDVAVFGIDDEAGQLTAIRDSEIFIASVAQDPVTIGKDCMEAAIAVLKGEEPEEAEVNVPGVLITKDNVEEYMKEQSEKYAVLQDYMP